MSIADKYDLFIKPLAHSTSNDETIEIIIDGRKMKPIYLRFGYTKYAVLKNLTLTAGEHGMIIPKVLSLQNLLGYATL